MRLVIAAAMIAALATLCSCAPKTQVRDAYDRFCGFVTDGKCAPFDDYKVEVGYSNGIANYGFLRRDAFPHGGRPEIVDAFGCMYLPDRILCAREDRNDDLHVGPAYDVPRH